jgi:hypothetical protein
VHTDRQETATPDRTKMSTPEPEIGQKCPVRLDKNGHSRLDKNVLHKRSIEKRNLKGPLPPLKRGRWVLTSRTNNSHCSQLLFAR